MPDVTPTSVATMDPNFEQRFRELKTHAQKQGQAIQSTQQRKNFRPKTWSGDPFDYEAMSVPFKRDKANQDLVKAISDATAPGTTGDVVVTTTMLDQLAGMERAFRVRHTLRRCRATAHNVGRMIGHGDDKGPIIQLSVEYVRALLRQASKPQ